MIGRTLTLALAAASLVAWPHRQPAFLPDP